MFLWYFIGIVYDLKQAHHEYDHERWILGVYNGVYKKYTVYPIIGQTSISMIFYEKIWFQMISIFGAGETWLEMAVASGDKIPSDNGDWCQKGSKAPKIAKDCH